MNPQQQRQPPQLAVPIGVRVQVEVAPQYVIYRPPAPGVMFISNYNRERQRLFAEWLRNRDAAVLRAAQLQAAQQPAQPLPLVHADEGGKFVKPPGEPGRPASGGFALKQALKEHGWSSDNIEKFIKDVQQIACAILDLSRGYSLQDPEVIAAICDHLSSHEKWPVLANYVDCWPVIAALKLHLKNAKARHMRKNLKDAAGTQLEDEGEEAN